MASRPERRMPSVPLAGVSLPGRAQEGTLAEHRGFERELDDDESPFGTMTITKGSGG